MLAGPFLQVSVRSGNDVQLGKGDRRFSVRDFEPSEALHVLRSLQEKLLVGLISSLAHSWIHGDR